MTRYISILRGINVSGQKAIKMDALKNMYANLGFEQVLTYVQSGNVIFSSTEYDTQKLAKIILSRIASEFGFEVPVLVLSTETLRSIIEENPLAKEEINDFSLLHVTFLANQPAQFNKQSIIDKKLPSEQVEFGNNAIYLYCPDGYGKTKLNNTFLENKLKVTATTRNWKTTNELLKLATQ